LYVAENLYGALKHFNQHPLRTPLWCDALSINQADNSEKVTQVRMMGNIYAHADEVVIWLGEEHETDRQALKILSRICELAPTRLSEMEKYIFDLNLGFDSRDLPELDDGDGWRPLANLLRRPWFCRLWVVQEYLRAASASFHLGTVRVSPDILIRGFVAITASSALRQALQIGPDEGKALQCIDALNALSGTNEERDFLLLFDLLMMSESFQTSDPRDRVFALTEMAIDTDDDFIDYNLDVRQVFINAAKHMMDLKIGLGFAQFEFAEQNLETAGLPSWVPDWQFDGHLTPLFLLCKGRRIHLDSKQQSTMRVIGSVSVYPMSLASVLALGRPKEQDQARLIEAFRPC
jgi:hypothetical protein